MIRKRNGKYLVMTSDGARVLGTHANHKDAIAQMRAIEASKHSRSKK